MMVFPIVTVAPATLGGQPRGGDVVTSTDGAKQRPVDDGRSLEPGLDRPNGARHGIRTVGNADQTTFAFLIGLRAPKNNFEAVGDNSDVTEVD